MAGPLSGLRIVELAGVGPVPFCGMMLSDHGAQVIRVERPGARVDACDPLARSRDSIVVDIRSAEGAAVVRDLARSADGFMEGFRSGVAERLGIGPETLLADNPKLVYGRMTGWGQTGPYAQAAGHDINYLALSGALHGLGRAGEKPTPPLNLVGNFGGGAMMLAFAMVCALLTVQRGGKGQVIFGPVMSILSYDTEEDAVRMANDTVYGLAAYVSSADMDRARRVGSRMRAGTVYLNNAAFDIGAPFGGYKQSGNGREWAEFGLDEFLETKGVVGY